MAYNRNFDGESTGAATNLGPGNVNVSTLWTIDNSTSDTASNSLKISNDSMNIGHNWQYDTSQSLASGDFTFTFAINLHVVNVGDGGRMGWAFRINSAHTTCYVVSFRPQAGNTTMRLAKFSGGGETTLTTVDYGSQILADTWYYIKVFMSGTTIKARAWKKGDSEPGTWNIDTTDASLPNTDTGTGPYFFDGTTNLRYGYLDTAVEEGGAVVTVLPRNFMLMGIGN